jgi:hypothetical protein
MRMPIGADLVLHEDREPEWTRTNGSALGRVIERAARRWNSPLAIPLMDLRLEKIDLLAPLGISESGVESFHFAAPLDDKMLETLSQPRGSACPGSRARNEALAYIAAISDLFPVGMVIGPYSLTTRLLADPIAATALAGCGKSAEESPEVRLIEQCLHVAEAAVERSVKMQIAAGAETVMVCEPAACTAFFSPRQIRAGSDIFERLVMEPILRLKAVLQEDGCELIFHDCGLLSDFMVEAFAHRLHPAMLSLGSSRELWRDAELTPPDVVLYGNLPTKSFYSDSAMPLHEVERRTRELADHMRACGHPHILGSECDVLFVPEAAATISSKVDVMLGRPALA